MKVPPLPHLSLHKRFRFLILRNLPGAPRCSVSCLQPIHSRKQRPGSSVGPPGACHWCGSGQLVGEGLLQAQRAVVRKRMAVVVFNQSCQVREGHLLVQAHQAILENTGQPWLLTAGSVKGGVRWRRASSLLLYLFKQAVVPGFADADVPHHQHLEDTPASPRGPHTPQIVNQASCLSVYLHSQSLAFPFTF